MIYVQIPLLLIALCLWGVIIQIKEMGKHFNRLDRSREVINTTIKELLEYLIKKEDDQNVNTTRKTGPISKVKLKNKKGSDRVR